MSNNSMVFSPHVFPLGPRGANLRGLRSAAHPGGLEAPSGAMAGHETRALRSKGARLPRGPRRRLFDVITLID